MILKSLIAGLSDRTIDLSRAFPAAKNLFLRAGRQDLADWALLEHSGYSEHGLVPNYRKVPAIVKGTVSNDDETETIDNHPLPTWHLSGGWDREDLRVAISTLEAAARGDEPYFIQPIHPNNFALFTRGLRIGGGYRVTRAWWQIGIEELPPVIAGARDRLRKTLVEMDQCYKT